MNNLDLERLEAEWDAVPSMCGDFDLFCESMTQEQTSKYARLVFNLPMHKARPIPSGTWIQVNSVTDGAANFTTETGTDRVTLDFVVFGKPPVGTIIYGTKEKIL